MKISTFSTIGTASGFIPGQGVISAAISGSQSATSSSSEKAVRSIFPDQTAQYAEAWAAQSRVLRTLGEMR